MLRLPIRSLGLFGLLSTVTAAATVTIDTLQITSGSVDHQLPTHEAGTVSAVTSFEFSVRGANFSWEGPRRHGVRILLQRKRLRRSYFSLGRVYRIIVRTDGRHFYFRRRGLLL